MRTYKHINDDFNGKITRGNVIKYFDEYIIMTRCAIIAPVTYLMDGKNLYEIWIHNARKPEKPFGLLKLRNLLKGLGFIIDEDSKDRYNVGIPKTLLKHEKDMRVEILDGEAVIGPISPEFALERASVLGLRLKRKLSKAQIEVLRKRMKKMHD